MHANIVINGKKVATTNDIVKFEGTKSMNYLAQQFDNANGWDGVGKDTDYVAKYVKDAIVKVTIKNPDKNVSADSTYELVGAFGGQPAKRNLPLDNTLHETI